jgi:hypothetical protein
VTPSFEDLERLAAFEADGQPALSIYLNLTTAEKRKSASNDFERMATQRLAEWGIDHRRRKMLQEDIEIVQMYLNNVPRSAGLAIFSCASRLFWRAYSLPVAVLSQVDIGPTFNLDPLITAMKEMRRRQALLAEAI